MPAPLRLASPIVLSCTPADTQICVVLWELAFQSLLNCIGGKQQLWRRDWHVTYLKCKRSEAEAPMPLPPPHNLQGH